VGDAVGILCAKNGAWFAYWFAEKRGMRRYDGGWQGYGICCGNHAWSFCASISSHLPL